MGRGLYGRPPLEAREVLRRRRSSFRDPLPISRVGLGCALSNFRSHVTDSKGTVLVIDDEEPVRQVASEILGYLGYSVVTAGSGEDGVKRVREGMRPDVVLLDVIMPGMNGFQTRRKLRPIDPDL